MNSNNILDTYIERVNSNLGVKSEFQHPEIQRSTNQVVGKDDNSESPLFRHCDFL